MRKKIRWQWWKSPLGGGREWQDYEIEKPPARNKAYYAGDDDESELPSVRPVVMTSAGIIPVKAYGDMSRDFNMVIAHTNFDVTDEHIARISEVPGIEDVTPLTRYRVRLGVGLAFDEEEVRRSIDELCGVRRGPLGEQPPAPLRDKANMAVESAKRHKYWAVYVFPNGNVDMTTSAKRADVDRAIEVYTAGHAMVGGAVYSYDD